MQLRNGERSGQKTLLGIPRQGDVPRLVRPPCIAVQDVQQQPRHIWMGCPAGAVQGGLEAHSQKCAGRFSVCMGARAVATQTEVRLNSTRNLLIGWNGLL